MLGSHIPRSLKKEFFDNFVELLSLLYMHIVIAVFHHHKPVCKVLMATYICSQSVLEKNKIHIRNSILQLQQKLRKKINQGQKNKIITNVSKFLCCPPYIAACKSVSFQNIFSFSRQLYCLQAFRRRLVLHLLNCTQRR